MPLDHVKLDAAMTKVDSIISRADAGPRDLPLWRVTGTGSSGAAAEIKVRAASHKEASDKAVSQKMKVRDVVMVEDGKTKADAGNDELAVIARGTPERGFKIPPPSDPKERAEYEAGVARRKAEGRGPFVGDR